MEVFGIGPLELLFIVLLMLIVLGPKDMVKTGQRLGRMIRNMVRSPAWNAMMNTSRELRDLPTKLVRESGLEEEVAEISKLRDQVKLRDLPGQILQELGEADPSKEEELNQIRPAARIIPPPDNDGQTEEYSLPSNGSGSAEDIQKDGRPQGE